MSNQPDITRDKTLEKRRAKWKSNPAIKILLKGMIVTLPIVIMVFLIFLILNLIFGIIKPLSLLISPGSEVPHWIFHIFSLIILMGIFYLVGLGIKHRKGRYYQRYIEREYLMHIPLYSVLKDLVQQFTGLKEMPFSQVVLIDSFDTGVLMTGFITEQVTEDIYTVFVPTAPNPTNGNIYHVPKSRLQFIDATSDAAMRTIVGMGTGSNCLFTKKEINAVQQLNT